MTEPVVPPSALFGADGTELPDPLPVFFDPLTGPAPSFSSGITELPSVPLPPALDEREVRATMAALFGPDSGSAPDSGSDSGSAPDSDPTSTPQAWTPAQRIPPQRSPGRQASAQQPAGPAGPSAPNPMYPFGARPGQRPQTSPSTPQREQRPQRRPVDPKPQKSSGPAKRPLPRVPMVPLDLRRRLNLDRPAGELRRRSGGWRLGCIVALIIFGIIALNIIAGLMELLSSLFS